MKYRVALIIAVFFAGVAVALAQPNHNPWGGCCGFNPWPSGMMGSWGTRGGMMGGSMPRHHYAMMSGVPAAYRSLRNPLPRNHETVERGRVVYEQNCAICHGATGAGDGAAVRNLSPPPANLSLLSEMPIAQWDGFMYWTVSEGGAQFGTAMPAFKAVLPQNDRWAVIAYVQARLPETPRK